MRIYIMTDFEGIAGFLEWDDPVDHTPGGFEKRHRLRTFYSDEVNAAVTACFESGAEEVLVWDSHGPSMNCNNLYIERLHPETQIIQGWKGLPSFYPCLDESFDAAMYIGLHAMEGTPHAVVPHTRVDLNGKALGEGGMFQAICSYCRVPAVFMSGDSAAIDQILEWVPETEAVRTKWSFGPNATRTRTPAKSCELIHEGVKRALARKAHIPCCKLEKPYVFEFSGGRRVQGDDLFELINKEVVGYHKWNDQDIEPVRSQQRKYIQEGLRYKY